MCDALVELMKDVIEEKENEAWNNGAKHQLLEQIAKKLSKGKSIEQIADELEESIETIEKLITEL